MSWSLAIDFGTSNTAAAYRLGNGAALPVRLSDQAEQMPSAVLALETGILVGTAAVRSARLEPARYEPNPKRRVGEGEVLLGAREYSVAELIAAVLAQVRQRADRVAGHEPLGRLVLTYPEQWAAPRREVLRESALRAGFAPGVLEMRSEPVAAASWYASVEGVRPGDRVAVFDFGGGTCDVAVLSAGANGGFDVLAAAGADPLGGEHLDQLLLDWTLDQLTHNGFEALRTALMEPANLAALLTLREQVRQAKHELSDYESARIPVALGSLQSIVTITAAEFDALISPDIDAAVLLTTSTLRNAGVSPRELRALYLTGGSSHLRLVHRRMTDLLGRPPATLNDPKLVVAQGALLTDRLIPAHSAASTPSPAMPAPLGLIGAPRTTGPVPTGPVPMPTGPVPLPTGPVPTGAVPNRRPASSPAGAPPSPSDGTPGSGTGGQSPFPPPFSGPSPAGSTPLGGGRSSRTRSRVLAAAIAAVVVAAVVLGVVVFRQRNDTPTLPDGPTTSSSASTAPTSSTTTSSSTSSQTTTSEPTGPTKACWDGSDVPESDGCTALSGVDGLTWVFGVADEQKRDCELNTDPNNAARGEVEIARCTFTDLPDAVMWLSRWDTVSSIGQQYSNWDKQDWIVEGNETIGERYDYRDTDDGTRYRLYAYTDHALSALLVVSDPKSENVQEMEDLDASMSSRLPGTIGEQSSS